MNFIYVYIFFCIFLNDFWVHFSLLTFHALSAIRKEQRFCVFNKHNPKSAQHLRKRTPQILIIKIENFEKYRKQQDERLKVAGEWSVRSARHRTEQYRKEQGAALLCSTPRHCCPISEPNRTEPQQQRESSSSSLPPPQQPTVASVCGQFLLLFASWQKRN